MEGADRTIRCVDCAQEFIFTASEQEFFREKGFTSDPKRCQTCRRARKASGGPGQRPSGPPKEPRGRSGPVGRDGPPRRLFDAVCNSCNKPTQVPFQPSPGRPVFCRDCFRSKGGPRPAPSSGDAGFGGGGGGGGGFGAGPGENEKTDRQQRWHGKQDRRKDRPGDDRDWPRGGGGGGGGSRRAGGRPDNIEDVMEDWEGD